MKTRMHRFWLSLSLAAGSLASPLSDRLWSHDLPTRWSSEAAATGSSGCGWNYLLDDCLDSHAAGNADRSTDQAFDIDCQDWDNPASNYLATTRAISPQDFDFDSLVTRNSLAKFTLEMTGWVQEWDRLQKQAGSAARARLVAYAPASRPLSALRPDLGVPPAPAIVAIAPVAAVDTCIFEKEYQKAQDAHDQLAAAFSPAPAAIAAPEAANCESAQDAQPSDAIIASSRCQFAMDDAASDSDHYSAGNYYLDDLTVAHYDDSSSAAAAQELSDDAIDNARNVLSAESDASSNEYSDESNEYSDASSDVYSDASSYEYRDASSDASGAADEHSDASSDAYSDASSDDIEESNDYSDATSDVYSDFSSSAYSDASNTVNSDALEQTDSQVSDQLANSLAAAAAIEAASIDAISAPVEQPMLCGGEAEEIVSYNQPCYPSVANCVDEYMPYDVDPRDAHWMGGLGKAWKLSAAASTAVSANEMTDSEGALPEQFGSDESLPTAQATIAAHAPTAPSCPEVPADADAQQSEADAEFSTAAPSTDAIPPVQQAVVDALQWLDDASCSITAELCGMDGARALGAQWGQWTLNTAQQSIPRYVAIGHYLDLPPAVANPGFETVVVYTDLDGVQTSVPSSLARAWNRPASDYDDQVLSESPISADDLFEMFEAPSIEQVSSDIGEMGDIASSDESLAVGNEAGPVTGTATIASKPSKTTLYDLIPSDALSELRQEVLSVITAKLDSLGIRCLETADQLSNWAETQIASRMKSDVR